MDQSYYLISSMMVDKNEKLFAYIKARITQNFTQTWFFIFQQAATFVVPILMVVCYIQRVVSFAFYEGSTDFDFTSTALKF